VPQVNPEADSRLLMSWVTQLHHDHAIPKPATAAHQPGVSRARAFTRSMKAAPFTPA